MISCVLLLRSHRAFVHRFASLAVLGVVTLGACGIAEAQTATAPTTAPAQVPQFEEDAVHLRVNLIGYLPGDAKVAIAFANVPVDKKFAVVDEESGETVYEGELKPMSRGWGNFSHYYELDFSDVSDAGRYSLRVGEYRSPAFSIGEDAYGNEHEKLVGFMQQQRCGYNPFLDVACHQLDGRTAFGPMPDGTFIDASGGWHDAGDQLKYLLTGSSATGRMLLAYELEPEKFRDAVDALGHPFPNAVPDVLDEARWGLEWMHKLNPRPGQLYHQVADDRDHIGWKLPTEDRSDYGWGPNSYRVVYFATGEPQGLSQYKSESDGVANLAGRFAAAMAMGARLFEEIDPPFAEKCLLAARDVYALGKAKEGVQQGNSYKSPYRYGEITWADDMEWGAAELYKVTGEASYLDDARRYAQEIGGTSVLQHDKAGHYAYFPFVNVGHFALYPLVDDEFKQTLAGYYREGLDHAKQRAGGNPFNIGVPFIWCSANLTSGLITQGLLYEKMTGDASYRPFILAQRDWVLGRNPWGTSLITGVPADQEHPVDIHTSVWMMTKRPTPGGLVDGPVYAEVYNNLAGLHLTEPDEFAPFQTDHVVYHDDNGDYSTNEPTMDGTADTVYWMAHFGAPAAQ